jgi:hypothetical protein
MDWRIGTTYFAAIFGYDKKWPYPLVAYKIIAWVKDPSGSRDELARKLFNSLPDSGWRQAGPSVLSYENTSISCVLWDSGSDKLYVEIVQYVFKEPTHVVYMTNEGPVQGFAIVQYYDITSSMTDPTYFDMKAIQDGNLFLYGGGLPH